MSFGCDGEASADGGLNELSFEERPSGDGWNRVVGARVRKLGDMKKLREHGVGELFHAYGRGDRDAAR
jgi:hypothetical protein